MKKNPSRKKAKAKKAPIPRKARAARKSEKPLPVSRPVLSAANAAPENELLSWETFDHLPSEEEKYSLWLAIFVSGAMIIWFGWQKDITAALVFVLMLAVSWMFLNREPSKIIVKMTKDAFWLNDEKCNVIDMEYFWFTERSDARYLNIKTKRKIMPVISVVLTSVDIISIKKALLNFIPEISPEEIENMTKNYDESEEEMKND